MAPARGGRQLRERRPDVQVGRCMAVIEETLARAGRGPIVINIEEGHVERVVAAGRSDLDLLVCVALDRRRGLILRIRWRLARRRGDVIYDRLGADRLQTVGQARRDIEHPTLWQDLGLLAVD